MIRNSILLMFCFLSFSSFSHDGKKIDSLKNELKKNKKDKFQDYKKLTLEFYNSDSSPDEFEKYCKITYSYALTKNNNNYIAVSKTLFALLNNSNQNYSESYKNLKENMLFRNFMSFTFRELCRGNKSTTRAVLSLRAKVFRC